jgi:hypothetical protein
VSFLEITAQGDQFIANYCTEPEKRGRKFIGCIRNISIKEYFLSGIEADFKFLIF